MLIEIYENTAAWQFWGGNRLDTLILDVGVTGFISTANVHDLTIIWSRCDLTVI